MKEKQKKEKIKEKSIALALMVFEALLVVVLAGLFFVPSFQNVLGYVNSSNVTVITLLDIGNAYPEILNITLAGLSGVDLIPNSTRTITFIMVLRDFNGASDITSLNATIYDSSTTGYGSANDNNNHYTNDSCTIDSSYGDVYEAMANCTFFVDYYANNASWRVTGLVNDSLNTYSNGTTNFTINTLLALGLPPNINYGEVNTTFVSDERLANVTNFGNTIFNLSLTGYGYAEGDGLAMNCTLGAIKNISVYYEKYNLTVSNTNFMTLSNFERNYTNLSRTAAVKTFNLPQRQLDASPYNDDTNATYWRIYVPTGVAGTCQGNIIFGAVKSGGT